MRCGGCCRRRCRRSISPSPMRWRRRLVRDIVFTLSAWALWYHYLAGIRHLIYDSGRGLDIPTAEKLGWACIFGSVVLTALTVIIV